MASLPVPESSRNRSDSLEEAGDRKRPRLDSDHPAKLETDIDEVLADTSFPESKLSSTTEPAVVGVCNTSAEKLQQIDPALVMATSPTSRVTINTRSVQRFSPPLPPKTTAVETGDEIMTNTQESLPDRENLVQSTDLSKAERSFSDAITISSSPSKSPEIQIAEVEDFDQDPNQTNWRPVTDTTTSSRYFPSTHYVHSTFPYLHNCARGFSGDIIPDMGKYLVTGSENDSEIFERLQLWLHDFLEAHDSITKNLLEEELDFWKKFPTLIECLMRRNVDPPAHARSQHLETFLEDFGRLSSLMMEYDIKDLSRHPPTGTPKNISDPMCRTYLKALNHTLRYSGCPFYEVLQHSHGYNTSDLIASVVGKLVDASRANILSSASALLTVLGFLLPTLPTLSSTFTELIFLSFRLLNSVEERAEYGADGSPLESPLTENIWRKSLCIFDDGDTILQNAITKQLAWLTIDNSQSLIDIFSFAFQQLSNHSIEIGHRIVERSGVSLANVQFSDNPRLVLHAWKFETLRKFIVSGRMELRVHGVEAMQKSLVAVYKDHIQPENNTGDPLVRYLVRFIRDTKLIEYLTGVDSHPQLIGRSFNILCFLCVAKDYVDEDTDRLWEAVVTSQDQRTVPELLTLLSKASGLLEYQPLFHMCTKVLALPIQEFHNQMLFFTEALISRCCHLRTHSPDEEQSSSSLPLRVCVHLLREVEATDQCSEEQTLSIIRAGTDQLGMLIRIHAIGGGDRIAVWQQCVDDLKSESMHAAGSIRVIRCFLASESAAMFASDLAGDFNFTTLLVDYLVKLAGKYAEGETLDAKVDDNFTVMISALSILLRYCPLSMPDHSTTSLWNQVFLASHPSICEKAWSMLTDITLQSKQMLTSNSFVDCVLRDLFQLLQARHMNAPVLRFVDVSVRYEMNFSNSALLDDRSVLSIPGIERAWRLLLEAPPGTIETDATTFIIQQYLDSDMIMDLPKPSVEATHLSLVERCVQQVISSAARLKSFTEGTMSGEDEPMVIIESDDEICAQEMRFHRSLLFLRKFLEGMKMRPHYSPPPEASVSQVTFLKRGEEFKAFYTPNGGKYKRPERTPLALGYENTGSELWQYLADLTGFEKFQVISNGQKVELLDVSTSLRDLRVGPGNILVNKIGGTPERLPSHYGRPSSPVDSKVLIHFDELYELLDLNEKLAKEVYDFLFLFPPQISVIDTIRAKSASVDELLPPAKPFRLLYCAKALHQCMEQEYYSSSPDVEFLQYGVRTIIAAFPQLQSTETHDISQIEIANRLFKSLLFAFRTKVSSEVSQTYIIDHEVFVHQLLRLLSAGQKVSLDLDTQASYLLVSQPLELLIEGSLHDQRMWPFISANPDVLELLEDVLLRNPKADIRVAIRDFLLQLNGVSASKRMAKESDPKAVRSRYPSEAIETCLSQIWSLLSTLLRNAVQWPFQCRQVFESSLATLRSLVTILSPAQIEEYIQEWSESLSGYLHHEIVGSARDDQVVPGLTSILLECNNQAQKCKLAWSARLENVISNEYRKLTETSSNLIETLLSKFLFPSISEITSGMQKVRTPVLTANTRGDLYNLVLALCQNADDKGSVAAKLESLVKRNEFFNPAQSNERQCLRSDAGYAGLRNLSNTCYLNSLFAQLFMNVQFRQFMISAEVIDDSDESLIENLGQLFGKMQSSYTRWVDPLPTINSIVTYDNENIDVNVQMDVDEFFNLLFDRLEGQLPTTESRAAFKSIYGGQIVQQVKSKECEHISERLEPFSAVQIEIKGKIRLEDGLKAYVEGEILQGDNKYSCTSCGRHVDAVKRACLKDVPDNLIFNLKRFDYDIMTGTRCKINDEFQFPEDIDMAPYTLEHLSDPNQPLKPDVFELVGVLVHAGTAESGHYYSFVRARPSSKDKTSSWMQFNDVDVSQFDPATIRETCFGGIDLASSYQWPKCFSAYMLFYQRTSSLKLLEQSYTMHDALNPIRLPLSPETENETVKHNEAFLQSYCIQDPVHARFVRMFLDSVFEDGQERCSETHELESRVLAISLDYIFAVSSRWKDCPDFESTVKELKGCASRCPSCAESIAQWFTSTPNEPKIIDAVLKSPFPLVRRNFSALLLSSLRALSKSCRSKGSDGAFHVDERLKHEYLFLFENCVIQLSNFQLSFHRYGRAWNDFFDLCTALINLGKEEALIFLDEHYLEKVLEIILVGTRGGSKSLRQKWSNYWAICEKTRGPSHQGLLNFLAAILEYVDISQEIIAIDRTKVGDDFGVTWQEWALLEPSGGRLQPSYAWLYNIIIWRHNAAATGRIITGLLSHPLTARIVANTLESGLTASHIGDAIAFHEYTLLFCAKCPHIQPVKRLHAQSLEAVHTIGTECGKEHVDFVAAFLKLENESLKWTQRIFSFETMKKMRYWVTPLIVYPNDIHGDVRGETLEIISSFVRRFLQQPNSHAERAACRVALQDLGRESMEYTSKEFLSGAQTRSAREFHAGQLKEVLQLLQFIGDECYDLSVAADEQTVSELVTVIEALKQRSELVVETMSETFSEVGADGADVESDVAELSEAEVDLQAVPEQASFAETP